jgi:hypothetical protein
VFGPGAHAHAQIQLSGHHVNTSASEGSGSMSSCMSARQKVFIAHEHLTSRHAILATLSCNWACKSCTRGSEAPSVISVISSPTARRPDASLVKLYPSPATGQGFTRHIPRGTDESDELSVEEGEKERERGRGEGTREVLGCAGDVGGARARRGCAVSGRSCCMLSGSGPFTCC